MISASLVNESLLGAKSNVNFNKTHYTFDYPCESNSECTDYKLILEQGTYKFELYGGGTGKCFHFLRGTLSVLYLFRNLFEI